MTRAADLRVPGYLGRVVGSDGAPLGTCFQVAPGVLVTACHVVTQAGEGVRVGQLDDDDIWDAAVVRLDQNHDVAVLRTGQPLKDSCDRLAASDAVVIDTRVTIAGYVEVDDFRHRYDYLQTSGKWQGFVRRDGLLWCRVTADSVLPGMSGAPVVGREDGAILGVVSGRYNSVDGWLAHSVWVTRCEDLGPLLAGVAPVRVRRPALRQAVDATLTVTDRSVRLTGPGTDISDAHGGVPPRLAAAVEELRAARVRSGIAHRAQSIAPTTGLEELTVNRAARLLAESFLPPPVAQALGEIVQSAREGNVAVRLGVQVSGPLARLPWEALREPESERPLALHPLINVYRKVAAVDPAPVPGPLRILIAIAAPDDDSARLDYQRELRAVLEAVRVARHANARVRIIPFASTGAIRAELLSEPVHVLHISGHGSPGLLHLEDAHGKARPVTADEFVDEAIPPGRMPAVIALAACHTDVAGDADDASLAARLCARGASVVVATETSITDRYSTWVFARTYAELVASPVPDAVAALAEARRGVQRDLARSTNPVDQQVAGWDEWAAVTVLAARGAVPIFDPAAPESDESAQPSEDSPGRVSIAGLIHRPLGGFVGRRGELRRWPAELTDTGVSGLVLHGIGGIGKTTLAAELVDRLRAGPGRWAVASVTGQVTADTVLAQVAAAFREHLTSAGQTSGSRWQAMQALSHVEMPWQERLALLDRHLLDEVPLLVVLDNFEDNLTGDSTPHRLSDPGLAGLLAGWAQRPGRSRLLITCRYPFQLPGQADRALIVHQLGPLTFPETLHLMFALPALDALPFDHLEKVWRLLGGHPRALEYLDAILAGGRARYPDITTRLAAHLTTVITPQQQGRLTVDQATLDASLAQVATIAADEVLLDDLTARLGATPGAVPLLMGASVYREPFDSAALLFHIGEPDEGAGFATDWPAAAAAKIAAVLSQAGVDIDGTPIDLAALPQPTLAAIAPYLAELRRLPVPPRRAPGYLDAAIEACVASSLLSRDEANGQMFVHRWTTTELHRRWAAGHIADIAAAHLRAAEYWQWRAQVWPQDDRGRVHDLIEARHHLLEADEVGSAHQITRYVANQLERWGAWDQAATLTHDMLKRLPAGHPGLLGHHHLLGVLAQHRGDYPEAERRYKQALDISKELGDRAGMAACHGHLGLLAQHRGDYAEAERRYRQALEIDEQRGNRAGIATAYYQLGVLAQLRSDHAEAQRRHRQALDIYEELGDRAGIAYSYHCLGALADAQGDHPEAERRYQQALNIHEGLGNRAGIADAHHQLGSLAQVRGDYPEAQRRHRKALNIYEELGNRAGLAASYGQLGIMAHAQGDHPEAERRYRQSLKIDEELGNRVGAATSYSQLGNLAEDRQQLSEATYWHLKALLMRAEIEVPGIFNNIRCLRRYRGVLGLEEFSRILTETAGQRAGDVIRLLDLPAELDE